MCLIISIGIGVKLVNKDNDEEKKDIYLAMGDYLTSVQDSYSDIYHQDNNIKNYSKFLSRKSMTSADLLRLLTIDTSIIYKGYNHSISSIIKKSEIITISLGYNDIMNNVRYNSISNEYIYDCDILDRLVSSLQSNLFDIIEFIYSYNDKVKVYVLSSYYPYPRIENSDELIVNGINEAIKEACKDSGAGYVDINGVSKIDYINDGDYIPNNEGMKYIANLI